MHWKRKPEVALYLIMTSSNVFWHCRRRIAFSWIYYVQGPYITSTLYPISMHAGCNYYDPQDKPIYAQSLHIPSFPTGQNSQATFHWVESTKEFDKN